MEKCRIIYLRLGYRKFKNFYKQVFLNNEIYQNKSFSVKIAEKFINLRNVI